MQDPIVSDTANLGIFLGRRRVMGNQLKAISYTDEVAKEIVRRFCCHVHWLITVRHNYKVLFEDEQQSCHVLMEKTASSFFADLNRILQEYLLLECAKITDPATTGDHENFTVDHLLDYIYWPGDKAIIEKLTSLHGEDKDLPKELESLRADTKDFRKFIKPARDKLLAHLDRGAVLSGAPIGAFPEGEDKKFFVALQKICNITHEACFGEIYGEMSPVAVGGGDVISLRRTLEYAVAFKNALSQGSGQSKTWLYSCLGRAWHEPNPSGETGQL